MHAKALAVRFLIVSARTCNTKRVHHAWFSSESAISEETGKRKRLEGLFLCSFQWKKSTEDVVVFSNLS